MKSPTSTPRENSKPTPQQQAADAVKRSYDDYCLHAGAGK